MGLPPGGDREAGRHDHARRRAARSRRPGPELIGHGGRARRGDPVPGAGAGRGGDLKQHDDWLATCLRESEGLLDVARLSRLWAEFRELPRADPDVLTTVT
jgi:hypothetical protein